MKLRASGKADVSKIVKDFVASPKRATRYRRAFVKSLKETRKQLSPLQAFFMFVEANLSRKQYKTIRSNSDKTLFLCYPILLKAKKEAYPLQKSYRVTTICAEINLQDLLDHTVARLLQYLEKVIETLSQNERNTMEIICKWECDGSHQVQFKQRFENQDDSDSNIFQSSLVPLQLVCGTGNKKIIAESDTLFFSLL